MKCNWSDYNKSLINRGSINFWFSPESCKKWKANRTKKAGRPYVFSDEWIEALSILRFVFHLPLRQLQGFAVSLLQMQKLSIPVPHYSCICKRGKKIPASLKKKKVTDIVFDTSGVRIFEAGEWKKEKYGGHRKWRKLHVAIDLHTKEIVYAKLTSASTHDLDKIDDVLEVMNKRKGKVLIDGIADQHDLYEKCKKHNKQLLTPPRQGASVKTGCDSRQEAVKTIKVLGGDQEARKIWSKLTGYNQRAQIETLFSRWKRILGESLKSKLETSCFHEVYVKSLIMNRMLKSS